MYSEGANIVEQNKIFHGFQSKIKVTREGKLFKKNKIFEVGRYHSLRLEEPFNSKNMKITMRCPKTNIAMGIEDHKNKIFGFGHGGGLDFADPKFSKNRNFYNSKNNSHRQQIDLL